jgi:hypothetical protein
MNYIDNSGLFDGLPERRFFSNGAKVWVIILSTGLIACLCWAVINEINLKQTKARPEN